MDPARARWNRPRDGAGSGHRRRGVLRISVLLGLTAVLAAVLGVWFAQPYHRQWRENRLTGQALAHYEQDRHTLAESTARRALALNQQNVEAHRILALLKEHNEPEEALRHWQAVVRAKPSDEQRLALARTALRAGDPGLALREFEQVNDAAGSSRAAMHELGWAIAVALERPDQIEHHLSQLHILSGEDSQWEAPLLFSRLNSTEAEVVSETVDQVEKMAASEDPARRQSALRALINHDLKFENESGQKSRGERLRRESGLGGEDYWLLLEVYRDDDPATWVDLLAGVRRLAADDPELISELSDWMLQAEKPEVLLSWLEGWSTDDSSLRLALNLAETRAYTAMKDWERMVSRLRGAYWQERDYLRLAHLSNAHRRLGQEGYSTAEWQGALLAARGDMEALDKLARLALGWNWTDRGVDLLWTLLERASDAEEWLSFLETHHRQRGETDRLIQVMRQRLRYAPGDFVTQAEWAVLSLLAGKDLPEATRMAQKLREDHPGHPAVLTALGLSYFRNQRYVLAAEAFDKLSPEEKARHNRQLYHAAVLARTGLIDQAESLLESWNGANLLPEESVMLEATRDLLATHGGNNP